MNLLYLVPKKIYDEKMSRDRFQQVEALRSVMNIQITGPGWNNWTGFSMIETSYRPDLILTYEVPLPLEISMKVPSAILIKEGWDRQRVWKTIVDANAKLIIFQHENILDAWSDLTKERVMLAHIPHCVDRSIYPPDPLPGFHERPWDVIVIGNMNNHYYPFRVRLRELAWTVLRKRGYKVFIPKHPGYRLPAPPGTYTGKDYATLLSQAKVVLSCSGHAKAAFLKYVEVPMAGAVFMADFPEDRAFIKNTIMELDPSWTDAFILSRIEEVLDNEDLWNSYAKRGHEMVKKHRTMTMFAEMFHRVCQHFFSDQPKKSMIWKPELES